MATDRSAPWRDPGSFATTLVVLYADAFAGSPSEGDPEGRRLLPDWHPETVLRELVDEFGAAPLPALFDRLMAGIELATTDRFYKSLTDFARIAPILSGATLAPDSPDLPDAAEIAWAITEAQLLGPPEPGDDEPFCDDVRAFVGAVLAQEGIADPPDVLGIAAGHMPASRRDDAGIPGIADAIAQVEEGKRGEIVAIVRSGLARLIDQVAALELRRGRTADLLERIRRRPPAR